MPEAEAGPSSMLSLHGSGSVPFVDDGPALPGAPHAAQHDRRARRPRGARRRDRFRSSAGSSSRSSAHLLLVIAHAHDAAHQARVQGRPLRRHAAAAEGRHADPGHLPEPRARPGARTRRRSPLSDARPPRGRRRPVAAEGRHAVRPAAPTASRASLPGPGAARSRQPTRPRARRAKAAGRAARRRSRVERSEQSEGRGRLPTTGAAADRPGRARVRQARRPRPGDPRRRRAGPCGGEGGSPRPRIPTAASSTRARSPSTRAGTTGAPTPTEMIRRIKLHWDVPGARAARVEGEAHGPLLHPGRRHASRTRRSSAGSGIPPSTTRRSRRS